MRWSGIRLPLYIRVDASPHPLRAGCRRDMLKFSAGKKRQRRDENKKGTGMRRIQPRFFSAARKRASAV